MTRNTNRKRQRSLKTKAYADLSILNDEMADFDADLERDEALDLKQHRDRELVRQWLAPHQGTRQ
jgi:hypothetical protein